MSLSPAATIVLTRAAERPDHRLQFHRKLPTGGRHKMIDALLREGLITETQGDYHLGDGALLIEDSATGLMLTTLALTDAGFRALKLDPPCNEPVAETDATAAPTAPDAASVQAEALAVADALEAAQAAPVAAPRASLRDAAAAVLEEWDDRDTDHIQALAQGHALEQQEHRHEALGQDVLSALCLALAVASQHLGAAADEESQPIAGAARGAGGSRHPQAPQRGART
jgi:hypothetical protein